MPLATTHSRWRGAESIKLQPTYPRFKRTAKGAVLTLVFRGPYVDLRTYGPAIGDSITLGAFDYAPSDELVYANSAECQPDGAGEDGAGTLTVVYTNEADAGAVLTSSNITREIDWTLLEKPLIQHPRYATGGDKELTDADRKDIEAWRADPGTETYGALTDNAKDYVNKVRKGIENFVVPAPLVRKTTRGTSAPTVSACGEIESPDGPHPSGYIWLKTADRGIRQAPASGWERVEEWTGAKSWDTDLYD